ncbi:MAG: PKD domain-containing protein [Candidatus Hodarchaeota archaeon]
MRRKGSCNSKNGKKNYAGPEIGILVAFLLLFSTWKASEVENTMEFGGNGLGSSLVHPIIILNGNAALEGFANNTGGNGTSWADAVVIENLEITAGTNEQCIALSNTDLYTVIRDCTLTGATSADRAGIYLYNCNNVNITGNNISGNNYGVCSLSSSNIIISGINVLENQLGFYLDTVSNFTFLENFVGNNAYYGFYSTVVTDSKFLGNTLVNNGDIGLYFDTFSNNNLIVGNVISDHVSWGIYIDECDSNNFILNSISDSCGDDGEGPNNWTCNFWADYETMYPDASKIGMYWDTPYAITGSTGSKDDLPLCVNMTDVNPVAEFITCDDPILENERVLFEFTGNPGNGIASYQWDFGDGSGNSTDASPVHQYATAGTYTVTLTVTDIDGDASSFSMEIEVAAGGGIDVSTIAIIAVGAGAGVLALGNVLQFMKAKKAKARS